MKLSKIQTSITGMHRDGISIYDWVLILFTFTRQRSLVTTTVDQGTGRYRHRTWFDAYRHSAPWLDVETARPTSGCLITGFLN